MGAQINIKSCCETYCNQNKDFKDQFCEQCHLQIVSLSPRYADKENSKEPIINKTCQCGKTNSANQKSNIHLQLPGYPKESDIKNLNDYNVNEDYKKSITAVFNRLENESAHNFANRENKEKEKEKFENGKDLDLINLNQVRKATSGTKGKDKENKGEKSLGQDDNSNNKKIKEKESKLRVINEQTETKESQKEQNFILNKLKDKTDNESSIEAKSKEGKEGKENNIGLSSNHNLKNYTFSSESNSLVKCDYFIKSMIRNKDSTKKLNPNNMSFMPKQLNYSPNEIILAGEFYFNYCTINTRLQRTKTKEVSHTKRYVLLTRLSLKFSRNKNTYISFGTIFNEIKLHDITKFDLIKNPFSKIHLYTINITYGKENFEISISSEDEKEVESWFKLVNYLMKSNFF